MLEMICAIPDSIGWTLVGATGMLTAVVAFNVVRTLVQMLKDWREERNANECAE